jgi:hypothetical protein
MTGWRRSWMTSALARVGAASAVGMCALVGFARAAALAGAAPGSSPAFSVSPATFDPNDPLTRSYFRPIANPGTTLGEGVIVTNNGDTPLDLYVYPVDGLTGVTSGTVYANRADPRQKAGLWLTSGVTDLTVQPHARQLVLFTIAVPADATPGDHVAGIAFENAHPTTGTGIAVTEIIREVLGVQVRVPGPGQFHLHLGGVSFLLPPAAPAASVVITLGDDGNRLGQPLLDVTLHGPNGFTDNLTRQLDTLLPGDTINYPIVWPHPLPAGAYTISVDEPGAVGVALTGTAQLASPTAGLPTTTVAPAGPSSSPSPATAAKTASKQSSSTPPWLIAALAAGGAVLAGLSFTVVGLVRRTRRLARTRHPSGEGGMGRREPIAGSS